MADDVAEALSAFCTHIEPRDGLGHNPLKRSGGRRPLAAAVSEREVRRVATDNDPDAASRIERRMDRA